MRTSSLVISVLGLSSGDWVPWASERARGGYVGKAAGEIIDPAHKKGLVLFSSLRKHGASDWNVSRIGRTFS